MNTTSLKNIERSIVKRTSGLMLNMKSSGKTWLEISKFWGLSKATAWRIGMKQHIPTDNEIRKKIGLPEIITIHVFRDRKGRFSRKI